MSSHNNYYNQYSPVTTSNDQYTADSSNNSHPLSGPQIIMPSDNYSVTENKIKRKPGRPKGSLNKNGYKKKHERFANTQAGKYQNSNNYSPQIGTNQFSYSPQEQPARILNAQGEPVYENQDNYPTYSSNEYYMNNENNNSFDDRELTFADQTHLSDNLLEDLDPISAAIQKTVQNTENGSLSGTSPSFVPGVQHNGDGYSNYQNPNNYSTYISEPEPDSYDGTSYYNNNSHDEIYNKQEENEDDDDDDDDDEEEEPQVMNPEALTHNQDLDRDLEKMDCPICKKVYSTKGNLKTHMKVVHQYTPEMIEKFLPNNSTKPLGHVPEHMKMVCPLCNQYYRSRANLRVHLKGTHSLSIEEARKYLPSNSNRSYSKNGADKIRCVVCEKTYLGAQNLKSHLRNTHKIADIDEIKVKVSESMVLRDEEDNRAEGSDTFSPGPSYHNNGPKLSYISPNHSFGQSLSNLAKKRKYQETTDSYYQNSDQTYQNSDNNPSSIYNNTEHNMIETDKASQDFTTSKRLRNVNSHTELPVELGGSSNRPHGNISSLTPSDPDRPETHKVNNESYYSGYYNTTSHNNNYESYAYPQANYYVDEQYYGQQNVYNNYSDSTSSSPNGVIIPSAHMDQQNAGVATSSGGPPVPNRIKIEANNIENNYVKLEAKSEASKDESFTKTMYGDSEEMKQKCLELHNSSVSQWNQIVQNSC